MGKKRSIESGSSGEPPDGVFVRLEPDILEMLRQRAGSSGSGRAGGVPHVIRTIIYEHLGQPLPILHGMCQPDVRQRAVELSEQGLNFSQVAEVLQAEGFPTARGRGTWHATQVRRMVTGTPTLPPITNHTPGHICGPPRSS